MNAKKLKNLLMKNEGPKLDFKQDMDLTTDSGRKELAKDVCAIANSKGGRGYILVGVEDKSKKVIGIDADKIWEEQIQQIVCSRIDPPIPVSIEYVNYEGKVVLVINIYDGPQRPYQLRDNGAFHIRRGSTTDIMRKQEIASALQENLMLNSELCPITSSNLNLLNYDLVDKYFKSQDIEVTSSNRVELMENSSMIRFDREENKHMLTLGGALVFCNKNNVYIPHNMIRIISKMENNNSCRVVSGNLLDMFYACEKEIKNVLPVKYPLNTLLEAVKNAILLRDYTIFDKEITITIGNRSICVESPGKLGVSGEKINPYFTKRNMWIYEKLLALDDDNRFQKYGINIYDMKKSFKNIGNVAFINSIRDNCFKVIFPGTDSV